MMTLGNIQPILCNSCFFWSLTLLSQNSWDDFGLDESLFLDSISILWTSTESSAFQFRNCLFEFFSKQVWKRCYPVCQLSIRLRDNGAAFNGKSWQQKRIKITCRKIALERLPALAASKQLCRRMRFSTLRNKSNFLAGNSLLFSSRHYGWQR